MALPINRPYKDVPVYATTTSIATTPVVAYAVAPCTGYVQRIFAQAIGVTTGTITVAVADNGGSDIAASALTLAAGTNAANSVQIPLTGVNAAFVNEGDLLSFTASGGTGSTIPGFYTLVIRGLT